MHEKVYFVSYIVLVVLLLVEKVDLREMVNGMLDEVLKLPNSLDNYLDSISDI